MSRAFRPVYGFRPATLAAPLAMPDQRFDQAFKDKAAPAAGPSRRHGRLARFCVLTLPLPIAIGFGWATAHVLAANQLTIAEGVLAVLSGFAVFWMAMSVVSSFFGLFWTPAPRAHATTPGLRVAILLPMYGEDAEATMTPAVQLLQELRGPGHGHRFSLHIVSDTRSGKAALAEAQMVAKITAERPDLAITYRHREKNTDYKQGNIRDWIMRNGGAYDAALILDADSVMGRSTVLQMADALVQDPTCALIQSPCNVGPGSTIWQRLQSFASRVYGGPHMRGFAVWTGSEGNFMGHNAIVRIKAFAACCGLPHLSGPRPLGGVVLSHDFVEAGLLRRAGWGVRIMPEAIESQEDAPESLLGYIKRDARWCQGNLQHMRLVTKPGFHPITRLHFFSGAIAYLGSAILLTILTLWATAGRDAGGEGLASLQAWLMGAVLVMLFAPRVFGVIDYIRRAGLPKGRRLSFVKMLALETVIAVLTAPVMMLHHCKIIFKTLTGVDTGWPQHSHGRIPLKVLAKFHAAETLIGASLLAAIAFGVLSPWLLPVALGLVLAVPVSAYVSGDAGKLPIMPMPKL